MKRWLAYCLLSAAVAGCGQDGGTSGTNEAAAGNAAAAQQAGQARGTIAEALAGSADHRALVEALTASGLVETLRGTGPYTLFAPTDAAFGALPDDARRTLSAPERRERLMTLLSYHVVPGTVTAADLGAAIDRGRGRAEFATVTGDNLALSREGQAIVIRDAAGGQARITAPDQLSSNGVVHSIDAVLMPAG
ncbi:MAG: fasciclin domain-containing protein [Allosphingosinicella sp.]